MQCSLCGSSTATHLPMLLMPCCDGWIHAVCLYGQWQYVAKYCLDCHAPLDDAGVKVVYRLVWHSEDCAICQEKVVFRHGKSYFACRHFFHVKCLYDNVCAGNVRCPLCNGGDDMRAQDVAQLMSDAERAEKTAVKAFLRTHPFFKTLHAWTRCTLVECVGKEMIGGVFGKRRVAEEEEERCENATWSEVELLDVLLTKYGERLNIGTRIHIEKMWEKWSTAERK